MGGRSSVIEKSPVNVTAKNVVIGGGTIQTNENSVIDRIDNKASSSSKAESASKEKIQTPEWCAKINHVSWVKTSKSVVDEFKNMRLSKFPKEVHPQMKWIEHYYEGEYKNPLMEKEGRFIAKHKAKEESDLTMYSLIEKLSEKITLKDGDNIPVTAITASAGSGKTTLLRRMVKQIMQNNGLIQSNNYLPSTDSLFDVIQYIELASKTRKDSTSLAEFLFEGYFDEPSDIHKAYENLYCNQNKFILCIDGLDQASWELTKDSMRSILPHQKADTETIMYNLLSRNLLPHVKIVITSREFKISTLPGESKPEHIIALTGLKFKDVKALFESLLEPDGERYWKEINKFSQRLLLLMATPLFLILSAIVTATYPHLPPPTTITELFNRIMRCLRQTDNFQERDQIFQVIKKLKVLAHQNMDEGKVVFKEADLIKHSLKMQDIRDLVMKVPGTSLLTRHLIDSDFLLCFCHQSFQEFFSASHIAEMSLEDFTNFCRSSLMSQRWSIVCLFTCGIIFGPNSDGLYAVSDREKKQEILKKELLSELHCQKGYRLLSVLVAMYETNDDQVAQSCPKELDLNSTPLNPDGVHLLSSFLAKRKEIDMLNLSDCGLDDELMKVLACNLAESHLHIKVLRFYNIMTPADDDEFLEVERFENRLTLENMNSFFRNLHVDEVAYNWQIKFSDFFKWNNVSRLKCKGILFTKAGSFVRIQHDSFSGSFDTKEKKLILSSLGDDNPKFISLTTKVIQFLETDTAKINKVLGKQYLEWCDIKIMNSLIGTWQIPDVLLRIEKYENVDVSVISRFVDRYQVEILDLVIFPQLVGCSINDLRPLDRQCKFKMHMCLDMSRTQIYKDISYAYKHKIKSLRIRLFYWKNDNGIFKIIRFCKQKMKSISLLNTKGILWPPSLRNGAHMMAKKYRIELDFREKRGVPHDAWYYCDFERWTDGLKQFQSTIYPI